MYPIFLVTKSYWTFEKSSYGSRFHKNQKQQQQQQYLESGRESQSMIKKTATNHRSIHFWKKREEKKTPNRMAAKEQFLLHICQTMHGAKVSRLHNLCTRIFGASYNLFCVLPTNRRRTQRLWLWFDAIRTQTINLCVLLSQSLSTFIKKFDNSSKEKSEKKQQRCFCSACFFFLHDDNDSSTRETSIDGSFHEIYVNIVFV